MFIKYLKKNKQANGIYNNDIDIRYGNFTSKSISFGGGADSFYEYLIKLHILLGLDNIHSEYLTMYSQCMNTLQSLLRTAYEGKLALGLLNYRGAFVEAFHHLTFFIPGMLLLSDKYLPTENLASTAINLLETFYHAAELSSTGLAPESYSFYNYKELSIDDRQNILRPELIESLFYAYKFTSNTVYQDRVWKLFTAMRTYSISNFGYAEYLDVTNTNKKKPTW